MEDDEEWVWKNAVKKDDTVRTYLRPAKASRVDVSPKIYHATCHAEASASKSTLAVRLRSDVSNSRSRSRTPEALGRSTPPKLDSPSPTRGVKRKAEEDDDLFRSSLHLSESGHTPPMKKVAISPA